MHKHVNLVDLVKSFPTSYSNEYFLAKFGFDTADNEPDKTPPRDLIFTYLLSSTYHAPLSIAAPRTFRRPAFQPISGQVQQVVFQSQHAALIQPKPRQTVFEGEGPKASSNIGASISLGVCVYRLAES